MLHVLVSTVENEGSAEKAAAADEIGCPDHCTPLPVTWARRILLVTRAAVPELDPLRPPVAPGSR
jgi:hypothetical protein